MKYNNEKLLCLTFDELVPGIIGKPNYDQMKARKQIVVNGRSAYGREVLIEFETLPAKYREAVVQKYGNPYEYIAKQPLVDFVKINRDWDAERFYNAFVLPNKSRLPEDYVCKYVKAATWLKAIKHFTSDKRALKQTFNISIETFWNLAGDLIRTHEVSLPVNSRKLKDKVTEFKNDGYGLLVETWRFGNGNSKKVNDKVSEALLLQLIAHPHKHDDTIITLKYNEWAAANNYATITPGTVGYWRKKNALLVTLTRDGSAINYSTFSKQVQRDRPSAPLLLINSDDNVLDLYFKEVNSKGRTNEYHRKTAYLVVDAFNDYILGYAIGETNTIELIQEAYRNAIHHVMKLTGGAYLWNQIQTDHWGIDPKKEGLLATYFSNQAHFTPATVRVAQAKFIERTFGTVWHQQLKMFANYSGHNITAKEKMNPDGIQIAKKDYPNKEQAPQVIGQFIENMRQTVNPATNTPRQKEWVEAFKASLKSKQRLLDAEKRLQLFGVTHPYSNKISSAGIRVEINKQKYTYDIANDLYLENVGKTVQVTYDPYDMGQVLISDGKGLRFVTGQVVKMPSALADFKEGDRTELNSRLEFKKRINGFIDEKYTERVETLERARIDAASMLQAGVTVKEISHQAQKSLTPALSRREGVYEEEEEYDWRAQL